MHEKIVPYTEGRTGILTLPEKPDALNAMPAIIYLNAVPDRIGVDYCRYLARQGIVCFRIDLPGTVDSLLGDDPRPLLQVWIEDAVKAIDFLQAEQHIESFVLIGVCKGARIAAEVATIDSRVVGAIPINLDCPASVVDRESRIRYLKSLRWWVLFGAERLPGKLKTLVQGNSSQRNTLGDFHTRIGDFFGSDETEVVGVWQKLQRRPVSILAVFSEFDHFYDFFRLKVEPVFEINGSLARFQLELVRNADHNLTAVSIRDRLQKAIHNWILKEFQQESARGNWTPTTVSANACAWRGRLAGLDHARVGERR